MISFDSYYKNDDNVLRHLHEIDIEEFVFHKIFDEKDIVYENAEYHTKKKLVLPQKRYLI